MPNFEKQLQAQTDKNQQEINKHVFSEKDFTPEDWKKVNELAFDIFEHRMAGDSKEAEARQKKWAKEYGLSEDMFTKGNIQNVLSEEKIPQWTPEAKHFMHDWDRETAIKAYINKKRDWERAEEEEHELAKAQVDIHEAQKARQRGTQAEVHQEKSKGRELGSRGSRTGEPINATEKKKKEHSLLDELRRLESESARAYAEAAGKEDASDGFIFRIFKRRKGDKSPEALELLKKWEDCKKKLDDAISANLYKEYKDKKISEEEFNSQSGELRLKSALRRVQVLSLREDSRKKYAVEKGWISGKVEAGWQKFEKVWKKIPLPLRFGVGVGLGFVGGYPALLGIGAMRVIGGIMSGQGMNEWLQKMAEKSRLKKIHKEHARFQKDIERRKLSADDVYKLTRNDLERKNEKLAEKIISEGKWDTVRKWAGITTGLVVGSGILANAVGRLGIGRTILEKLGLAETATTPAKSPGAGKEFAGKIPGQIEEGGNRWETTRRLYMHDPQKYGFDPNHPKVMKLFQSFKNQGILERLGIHDVDNFQDLTYEQKMKIWAENRTANSILKTGGIKDLVHAGDTVSINPDGTVSIQETSGIKSGYLNQGSESGTGKTGDSDYSRGRSPVRGGEPVSDAELDKRIVDADKKNAEAKARGTAIEIEKQQKLARLGAEAQTLGEEAIQKATSANGRLLNMWMERGMGNGFRLSDRAMEVRNAVRGLGPEIVSDQPLPPTPGATGQRGSVVRFTQEMFRRWPVEGNETMQEYLARMSKGNFRLFGDLQRKYIL